MPFEVVVNFNPLVLFSRVTVAPGTAAPDASLTSPAMPARFWAWQTDRDARTTTADRKLRTRDAIFMDLNPPIYPSLGTNYKIAEAKCFWRGERLTTLIQKRLSDAPL